MDLFATLLKKQKFTFFNSGYENRFFLANSSILNMYPSYRSFVRAQQPFDIIRANIVIRALQNKKTLDDLYASVTRPYRKNGELRHEGEVAVRKAFLAAQERMSYVLVGEDKVYIPVLPISLNEIYTKNPVKFEEKALGILQQEGFDAVAIDPFDAYGYPLFDSYFTNWIRVKSNASTAAFFDYDSLSIYIVNKQGRLDVQIALFDRQIGKRNTNHMMERILPVVDAYFRDDYEGLVKSLVDNQLVSSSLMYKVSSHEKRVLAKLERKVEK